MTTFEDLAQNIIPSCGMELKGQALNQIISMSERPDKAGMLTLTRTSCNGDVVVVANGKVEGEAGSFDAKNGIIVSGKDANGVANSRYSGQGYQTPLDTLTQLSTRLIERATLTENPEFSKVARTVTGIAPYAETMKFEVAGNSGGTVWDQEIAVNHNGPVRALDRENTFFTSGRKFYAYSLGYTELEMRQANASGIQAFTWEQRLKNALIKITNDQDHLRAFGMRKADGSYGGGLFNYTGSTINTSVFPASLADMTPAQMNVLAQNLIGDFMTNTNIGAKFDKLILPSLDVASGFSRIDTSRTAAVVTFKDLLMKPLQDAGMETEIIISQLASKNYNKKLGINGGNGTDFYVAINSAMADIYFDVPVDIQMILQPTQYGMGFNAIMIMQVGECVVSRPELAKIYT